MATFIGSSLALLQMKNRLAHLPNQVCLAADQASQTEQVAHPICFVSSQTLSNQKTTTLAVSPDGQILVSNAGRLIKLRQLLTGKVTHTLAGHADWVTALTVSPNGEILASASLDGTIKLWQLKTGQLLQTLSAGRMTTLAFSPNGRFIASGSRTRLWLDGQVAGGSGVQLWDVKTGLLLQKIGSGSVNAIAFSPDSKLLAMGSGNTQLWNLNTGRLMQKLDSGPVSALIFSSDGDMLVSGSSKVRVWNPRLGVLLYTFSLGASDLAISPDGQTLAIARGGLIELWQIQSAKFLGALRGSFYSGLEIAFGLDGRVLVSGSSDGMKIWRSQ